MRRFRIGARVLVSGCHEEHACAADPMKCPVTSAPAVVVRHGRDSGGVYTRVRFEDGREEDWHRASITAAGARERPEE